MEKYNILYTSDSNFFSHTLTSIYSLLENNKDIDIVIHIIEDGFTDIQKQFLYEVISYYRADVKIYSMEYILDKIEKYSVPKWRGTDIANARIFANQIIKNVSKILYIDSDAIIVDSLKSLFERKTNNPISAVKDLFLPTHMNGMVENYYNSGIVLFDYSKWEEEHCLEQISMCLDKYRSLLYYPDQDLLNLALKDRIDTLSMSYNIQTFAYEMSKYPFLAKRYFNKNEVLYSFEEIKDAIETPYIYHMLEYFHIKPWQKNEVHPFNDIYRYYRKKWDYDFIPDENNDILSQVKILSFINCFMKSILKTEDANKIKRLLKIYQDYNQK